MKYLFIIGLLLFSSFTNAQQYVIDPNAEPRELNGSFNAIRVSGGLDIYISQSTTEALAVSASDPKYLEDIKTVVENNVLKISGDGKWSMKNRKLSVYVSFKYLEKLSASGACDIRVISPINVPFLKIDLSGASDFVGKINTQTLDMVLTGSSDVKISGSASIFNINSSGASDVEGKQFIVETCNAVVSGASDINIVVNKEINAVASGASSVSYSGNATQGKITKTGASSVTKKS